MPFGEIIQKNRLRDFAPQPIKVLQRSGAACPSWAFPPYELPRLRARLFFVPHAS
jgi:hypothetical protein